MVDLDQIDLKILTETTDPLLTLYEVVFIWGVVQGFRMDRDIKEGPFAVEVYVTDEQLEILFPEYEVRLENGRSLGERVVKFENTFFLENNIVVSYLTGEA